LSIVAIATKVIVEPGPPGALTTPTHSTASVTISAQNAIHAAGAVRTSSTRPPSRPDIPGTHLLPNSTNGR
jgi:hypothetical protein